MKILIPLLVIVISLPLTGNADTGNKVSLMIEDSIIEFFEILAGQGNSGENITLTVPRKTYRLDREKAEKDQPGTYIIHRAPTRIEVRQWKIDSSSFFADEIIIHFPAIQVIQGTSDTVSNYLLNTQPHLSVPLEEVDSLAIYPPDRNPEKGDLDIHRLVRNPDAIFQVNRLVIEQGTLTAVDTQSSDLSNAQLNQINLRFDDLQLPVENRKKPLQGQIDFSVSSPTPGQIQFTFFDDSLVDIVSNFRMSCKVQYLDLTYLSPFIVLEKGWKIKEGVLGLDFTAECTNNQYNARHFLDMIGLSITSGRLSDDKNWAEDLVIQLLSQASKGLFKEVQMDFDITGNLYDPEFDLEKAYRKAVEESIIRWATLQTIRKFGLEKNPKLQETIGLKSSDGKVK